jgi:hypothetical protein
VTGVIIVVATVVSYMIGWLIGSPVLVPILNTAASYPFMVVALRRGDLPRAITLMLIWAATMALCSTTMSFRSPAVTDRVFLGGEAYRIEMHAWVRTGVGAESTPSQFIPEHVWHAVAFAVLTLASGGALAMPMGAVLTNYMGHYVGTLAALGAHPAALMILGWHPWAVIRIVSFVIIGVVLSVPLLVRVARWRGASMQAPSAAQSRHLLAWALSGLLLDIVVKAALAPAWQRLLLRLVTAAGS